MTFMTRVEQSPHSGWGPASCPGLWAEGTGNSAWGLLLFGKGQEAEFPHLLEQLPGTAPVFA